MVQSFPSPMWGWLQEHVKDPTVFVHEAELWQSCTPLTHSSISASIEEQGKTSFDYCVVHINKKCSLSSKRVYIYVCIIVFIYVIYLVCALIIGQKNSCKAWKESMVVAVERLHSGLYCLLACFFLITIIIFLFILDVYFLTSASFSISSKSCFTGTSIRSVSILTVGIDVTNRDRSTALISVCNSIKTKRYE